MSSLDSTLIPHLPITIVDEMRTYILVRQGFRLGTSSDGEDYHDGAMHWKSYTITIDKNT
jgi:hypothetical protein